MGIDIITIFDLVEDGEIKKDKEYLAICEKDAIRIEAKDQETAEKIAEAYFKSCKFEILPMEDLDKLDVFNEALIDKYYELRYFLGRKNTGLIYVKTDIDYNKCLNEDVFLDKLVKDGKISAEIREYISEVYEISVEDYFRKMEE